MITNINVTFTANYQCCTSGCYSTSINYMTTGQFIYFQETSQSKKMYDIRSVSVVQKYTQLPLKLVSTIISITKARGSNKVRFGQFIYIFTMAELIMIQHLYLVLLKIIMQVSMFMKNVSIWKIYRIPNNCTYYGSKCKSRKIY